MKKLIIFVCLALTITAFAQRGEGPSKKIRELEKIKLLEALQLDEETAVRFMARRSEHHELQNNRHSEMEQKLEKMELMIQDGKKGEDLKKLMQEYLNLEEKQLQERAKYITSLGDILSVEQISKMLIFEKKFREEMREAFMKERGRRGRQ